jgi:hypothetical protein
VTNDFNALTLPADWVKPVHQYLKKANFASHDIPPGSEPFKRVEGLLKQTLPNGNVKRIQILQNFNLWKMYKNEFHRLRDKLQKDPAYELLWHGTRGTSPQMIYEGEVGFNMNYCSGGMWGIAVYFAKNASYSHGYSS